MELRDIEIFLALAEELHFSRTAERLHVTPSRVSHVVKALERRIGAPLFDRTSRTVALTALGRQLRDDLLPAHLQIEHAVERAVAEARGLIGTLRVGYTTPWSADLLHRAARAFQDRHAGCVVQAREVGVVDPLAPLGDGDVDLQISELPVHGPGVEVGPVLFRERRALMLPAGHALATRDSLTLEELAEVPLLAPSGDVPPMLLAAHVPARTPTGRVIPRGASYAVWSEVPALVAAGLGASIVAARAARYHDRPGVAFVPLDGGPDLEYGVLWRSGGPPPGGRELVELLVALRAEARDEEAADQDVVPG